MTRIESFIAASVLFIIGAWMILAMFMHETGTVVPSGVADAVYGTLMAAWWFTIVIAAFKGHPVIVALFATIGLGFECLRLEGILEKWKGRIPNPFYALGFSNAFMCILTILCLLGAGAFIVYGISADSHREHFEGPIGPV